VHDLKQNANRVLMTLQGHARSLILAPTESAYGTSYWSSVLNGNLGPILPHFRDIMSFCTPKAIFIVIFENLYFTR